LTYQLGWSQAANPASSRVLKRRARTVAQTGSALSTPALFNPKE